MEARREDVRNQVNSGEIHTRWDEHHVTSNCNLGTDEGCVEQGRTGAVRTYLSLDSIISEAQVLQVCGGVGLHRGELVLQHMNDLGQLGVTPGKLPGTQTER